MGPGVYTPGYALSPTFGGLWPNLSDAWVGSLEENSWPGFFAERYCRPGPHPRTAWMWPAL